MFVKYKIIIHSTLLIYERNIIFVEDALIGNNHYEPKLWYKVLTYVARGQLNTLSSV